MEYEIKYILLADFFLEKRDIKQDGVEGRDKNFTFSEKELKAKGLSKKETIDMLETLKTETVWPKDEDGEKHKETVIKNYNKKGRNKIEIIDCTTDKLRRFKKKLRNELKESVIEINQRDRTIKYGDKSVGFNKAGRWFAFYCLYKNFPCVVEYEDIWEQLRGFEALNIPIAGDPPFAKRKKTIQNIISGLRKKMTINHFPKDAIVVVDGEGYRLIT